MSYPHTIYNPAEFDKSQWTIQCPHCRNFIGFDGIFHWGWVLDAIGWTESRTKIQPMDIDGAIERHYHYILFETKNVGVKVPEAQRWTLHRMLEAKSVCVFELEGKIEPQAFLATQYTKRGNKQVQQGYGRQQAIEYVRNWFQRADANNIR